MKKPHLACDVDYTRLCLPICVMPKYDGVRGLHIFGKLHGRSLKAHPNHTMTTYFSKHGMDGMDGELCYGDPTTTNQNLCNNTGSVTRTVHCLNIPDWHLFDYITPQTAHLGFIRRHEMLCDLVRLSANPKMFVIPYTICHTLEAVLDLRDDYLNAGYEGIILRSLDGKHKNGRATVVEGQFMRDKPVEDAEGELLSIVEAQENLNEAYTNELGRTARSSHKENLLGKGMVGALVLRDCETGKEIKIGPGTLSHNLRIQMWENPQDYLGKIVKYKRLAVGAKDAPRQGRFWAWRSAEDMS